MFSQLFLYMSSTVLVMHSSLISTHPLCLCLASLDVINNTQICKQEHSNSDFCTKEISEGVDTSSRVVSLSRCKQKLGSLTLMTIHSKTFELYRYWPIIFLCKDLSIPLFAQPTYIPLAPGSLLPPQHAERQDTGQNFIEHPVSM